MTVAELWDRGQAGWPRRFPLVQFPNAPMLVGFAGWGLASLTEGTAHEVGRAVLVVGFGVWALEEVAAGDNWFRRLLGAGALVWLAGNLAGGV